MILVVRLLLALVLAVAGIAKLLDPGGSRRALAEFGLRGRWVGIGAVTLPVVELALAVALVPTATATAAAAAAAVLFAIFALAIASAMRRGEEPDCGCFGQLHSSPAGPGTLARGVALAALAALVAIAGPGEAVGEAASNVETGGWIALAVAALVVVLAAQAWFSYQLLRQNGRLLARVRALEQGAPTAASDGMHRVLADGVPAPAFELPDLEGRPVSLDSLLADERPLALVFSDPGCAGCDPVLELLEEISATPSAPLRAAVISRGSVAENRAKLDGTAIPTVILQDDYEVARAYGVTGLPSALLIDAEGRIASAVAVGPAPIERLLGAAGPPAPLAVTMVAGR